LNAQSAGESPPGASGWRAYLDDDGQAVTFCPDCALRDFNSNDGAAG
jgi:hypothetical protein